MSRIFEHQGASEETVVSRILLSVHQAIDEQFPHATAASRQFTKTVFSDESISTALNHINPPQQEGDPRRTTEQLGAPGHTGISSSPSQQASGSPPQHRPNEAFSHTVPTAPRTRETSAVRTDVKAAKIAEIKAEQPLSEVPASQIGSSAGTQMQRLNENKGGDWTLRITLAMLLASILLLLYVVLN